MDSVNYHDGEWRYLGTGGVSGVKADEKNYSPWVQPGYFSSAWVMLTDSSVTHYSQFGWIEFSGGVRYLFSEVGYTGTRTFNRQVYSAQPINSISTVEVSWSASRSQPYEYFLNGIYAGGDNDSFTSFTPAEAQIYGETYSTATQMPGGYSGASHYQSWQNERVWYPVTPGGNWHYFNENFDTAVADDVNSNYFGQYNYPNPPLDSQYIWDRACPY